MKKIFSFTLLLVFALVGIAGAFPPPKTGQAAQTPIYADTGGASSQTLVETINYSYKEVDSYFNPCKLPAYKSSYTCGMTAGGNLLAHYNRVDPGLIPNVNPGIIFLGQWLWTTQTADVNVMFDSLYQKMGANSAGVTISQYLNGISSYATSNGRTATITNIMTSSGLNASQYKAAFQNNKVISVFVDTFAIVDPYSYVFYQGYDTVTTNIYYAAHVMTAYGYYNVSYYNAQNQMFRSDTYLYVQTGLNSPALGFVKLNQYTGVDDGYIISIN